MLFWGNTLNAYPNSPFGSYSSPSNIHRMMESLLQFFKHVETVIMVKCLL